MSKSKSTSKNAKPANTAADVLTKVKDAAIVKPAQTVKAKSMELAKQVVGKEEKKVKKDKKSKKAVKEPTPEPSESEESASSDSDSDSESEKKPVKKVANGKANGNKKPAAKDESSDDESASDSSDSESETKPAKANGASKNAKVVPAKAEESSDESDSDESMADAKPTAQATSDNDDSDDDSSDNSSDDEKISKPAAKKAIVAKAAKDSSDSESDADGSDSSEDSDEEEAPAAKPNKRKAEDEVEQSAKKTKTEAVDTSKGANLFVGNLSWNVDEAWLREVFEEFGELSGVRIMTDRDSGRSKGFGYVEFVQPEDAAKAHAAKAGTEVDGRAMNVDFANARPDNSQKQENRRKSYGDQVSQPSDTLFVGNLSFDVGQEAVTEAFTPHGTVLGIRLPTDRETGQPKGFGYVTFASVEEAQTALEAMQGAYIENRPIRLDYSTPRPQNGDSPARGRGGFGGRGGARGGSRGGRGGFGDRGGRGGFGGRGGRGGRGGSTNRGGFGDFSGRKTNFD